MINLRHALIDVFAVRFWVLIQSLPYDLSVFIIRIAITNAQVKCCNNMLAFDRVVYIGMGVAKLRSHCEFIGKMYSLLESYLYEPSTGYVRNGLGAIIVVNVFKCMRETSNLFCLVRCPNPERALFTYCGVMCNVFLVNMKSVVDAHGVKALTISEFIKMANESNWPRYSKHLCYYMQDVLVRDVLCGNFLLSNKTIYLLEIFEAGTDKPIVFNHGLNNVRDMLKLYENIQTNRSECKTYILTTNRNDAITPQIPLYEPRGIYCDNAITHIWDKKVYAFVAGGRLYFSHNKRDWFHVLIGNVITLTGRIDVVTQVCVLYAITEDYSVYIYSFTQADTIGWVKYSDAILR